MNVADIMHTDVVTVGADDTFAVVAKVLREHGISSVVVKGESGPAGIVTERDFVNLLADGGDATSTTVGLNPYRPSQYASAGPATLAPEMSTFFIRSTPRVGGETVSGGHYFCVW